MSEPVRATKSSSVAGFVNTSTNESGVEAQPDYSEVTPGGPGIDPEMKCLEGHFEVNFFSDTESQVRDEILSAETCPDFEDRGKSE